jgi:hypothetical protein
MAIALASHNGAQDLLARHTDYVGDDVGELHVHLGQRLLHMLDMARLAAQQHPALTPQRAQHTHLVGGAKCPAQQTVRHELLDPLAIQHIGLAPRDVPDVTGIDQHNSEATRLQQFEHGVG